MVSHIQINSQRLKIR